MFSTVAEKLVAICLLHVFVTGSEIKVHECEYWLNKLP